VDRLVSKHDVETYEVEEVFTDKPKIRFVEKEKEKERMSIWRWDRQRQEDTWQFCSSTSRPKRY
jgi:hypothetical protein